MIEKNKNKKLTIKHAIIQSMLILFALFLLFSVFFNAPFVVAVDQFAFNVASKIRSGFVNNLFLFITFLGETKSIILILIFLIILPNRKDFVPIFYLTGISIGINYIIKNLVQRARPIGQFAENLIINYPFPESFSFPSGHSQTPFVLYFVLVYILLNKFYKGKHKNLILGLTTLICVLIMISRIILGVHFLSDVLMGATIATIIITNYVFFLSINKQKTSQFISA